MTKDEAEKLVGFCPVVKYMNRGEVSERNVFVARIWFGSTEWHPSDQWLIDVLDLDRDVPRTFAVKDILEVVL